MLGRNGLAVLQAKSAEETAKRERDDFLGWGLNACALYLEGSLKLRGFASAPFPVGWALAAHAVAA